ncbi:MAG: POTRA domain-containing protein, partial [Bacteroidota bacterium]
MMLRKTLLFVFILTLVSSCNPTKRLAEGEVFLKKQNIQFESKQPDEVSSEDLNDVLKQKTNRKILLFRFHLWVHNRINPVRQTKARLKRKYRVEKKIQKKLRKGKELNYKELKEMRSDTVTWRDWMSETVGEAPVALDSSLMKKSGEQMRVYLAKHGYFDAAVTPVVDTTRNGKKATVTYNVKPNEPYVIASINYKYNDSLLGKRNNLITKQSTLQEGQVFDIDRLDDERERIEKLLLNKGYYSFSKDYVKYVADSTIGNHQVDVDMIVAPYGLIQLENDSTEIVHHKKYFIGELVYHTDYRPSSLSYSAEDSLKESGATFLFQEHLDIKPDLLLFLTTFSPGDIYMKERIAETYRRLSQLSMFRSVNIQMKERKVGEQYVLDCHIYLTPEEKYATSVETGVTHRDGLFGLSGSLIFRDRNVFQRSENGEFRIA